MSLGVLGDALLHKAFLPFFLGSLLSMLTISNPVSKIPLFVSLTETMTERERKEVARKACVYGLAMLTVTLFFGAFILEVFGISFGALRVAGGLTVAMLGFRMLFGGGYVGPRAGAEKRNVAIFPLALPGISGPGAIAVVIGISTEIAELPTAFGKAIAYSATVISIFITCVVIWLTLRSARVISQVVGPDAMEAATRIMGFLLVCIGVQFVGSGVRTFIGSL